MKLVNKDKVVKEIKRRIKETESMQPKFDQFWAGQISAFKGVLKILDILEVKEVDLEKEIDNIWNPRFNLGWDEKSLLSMNHEGFTTIAKHFFELGLKAKKGEYI